MILTHCQNLPDLLMEWSKKTDVSGAHPIYTGHICKADVTIYFPATARKHQTRPESVLTGVQFQRLERSENLFLSRQKTPMLHQHGDQKGTITLIFTKDKSPFHEVMKDVPV